MTNWWNVKKIRQYNYTLRISKYFHVFFFSPSIRLKINFETNKISMKGYHVKNVKWRKFDKWLNCFSITWNIERVFFCITFDEQKKVTWHKFWWQKWKDNWNNFVDTRCRSIKRFSLQISCKIVAIIESKNQLIRECIMKLVEHLLRDKSE